MRWWRSARTRPGSCIEALRSQLLAGNRIARPGDGREHFDLPGFVFDQLHHAGVGLVEDHGTCTYAEPKRYFSHRYATHNGRTAGRQIALIGLA